MTKVGSRVAKPDKERPAKPRLPDTAKQQSSSQSQSKSGSKQQSSRNHSNQLSSTGSKRKAITKVKEEDIEVPRAISRTHRLSAQLQETQPQTALQAARRRRDAASISQQRQPGQRRPVRLRPALQYQQQEQQRTLQIQEAAAFQQSLVDEKGGRGWGPRRQLLRQSTNPTSPEPTSPPSPSTRRR